MLSAVYILSPPPFISWVKYPLALVTLIWVDLTLPSFFLKVLCTRLLILDFNRSCGIEVLSVENSNVWTDVALWTSSWSSDDNKLVEFFRIHMLLIPLRLVFMLQYLANPSFMVLSSLVRRHDRSFVIHLLEPATNWCLYGDLCNLGVWYRYGRFWPSSDISNPKDVMNSGCHSLPWFQMSHLLEYMMGYCCLHCLFPTC